MENGHIALVSGETGGSGWRSAASSPRGATVVMGSRDDEQGRPQQRDSLTA